MPATPQIVKFVGRVKNARLPGIWERQISPALAARPDLRFTFDLDAERYDWFVVYDDLPPLVDERFSRRVETLRCPPANTILITSEPSSVRRYPRAYLDQFAYVISSQEPPFIRHPGHIHTQCGLRWYYGLSKAGSSTYGAIAGARVTDKTRLVSALVSSKRQQHTLHAKRVEFVEKLEPLLPELDRFGHGVRDLDDKAEALDTYRYHLAIENHIAPHHWTEKLSDSFLGGCLPFYCGAPNAADYFPEGSFVPINLDDPAGTARVIQQAIREDWWSQRLPLILEARRLVLERFGLLTWLAVQIDLIRSEPKRPHGPGSPRIASARRAQIRSPLVTLLDFLR